MATIEEILDKDANLSIPRYVRPAVNGIGNGNGQDLKHAWAAFETGGREFWEQMDALVDVLDDVVVQEATND